MYLSKIKINRISKPDSDIVNKLYQALDSNEIHVCYNIYQKSREIQYFFSDVVFGECGFHVNSNGDIVKSFSYNSENFPSISLVDAFIHYMYEKESQLSDDKLRDLYTDIYDEEIIKKGLSTEQIEQFDSTKESFKDLLSSIDTSYDEEAEIVDKLYFKLILDDIYSLDEFKLKVYDEDYKYKYNFEEVFERYILNGYQLDEESKKILLAFSPLYNPTSSYSYCSNDYYKKILGQGLKALKDQKCERKSFKPFEFDDEDFDLNSEVKNVEVTIDKDGNIVTSYQNDSDCEYYDFKNPREIMCFDMTNNIVSFLVTRSETEKKLFLFKMKNPMFNTKYFEKEISQSLVPTVKDVISIEQTYLSNSLKKIDHIEYYIDLDNDKLELICKTNYFLGGNEVTAEEYKERYANNFNNFTLALDSLLLPDNGVVSDVDIIVDFISDSLTHLKKACQVFVSEDVKKLKKKPVAKINILVQSNQDWFSFDFQSNEYSKEEVESILAAYKKKKRYYRLRNDILKLDEGDGKDIITLMNDFDINQEKIPVYQALKLKSRQNVTLSDELRELFDKIQDYDDQKLSLDENLMNVLRPYQIKGIQWLTVLKENHLSGILADDMGLGKTLEIIAFLSQYHNEKPNLVVSPKSLTFNWEDEFHKWNPKAKVVVLSSSKEDRHNKLSEMRNDDETTYIISYDSLRIDLDLFRDKEFSFLILDEGQYISNAFSQKSRAVKTLTADYKFALTGTPIQNSLMDLWSLFDFLMPGYLKSFFDFKKLYGKFDLDAEDRKHLENIVSPFLLKRKKDDVLTELPGKIIMTQNLVMDDEEKVLYEAYLSKARNAMLEKQREGKSAGLEVLSALTRLRQLCVDPSSFLEFKKTSSKLEYTIFLIKEAIAKGHKILLFSSFTTVLDHVAKLLDEERITHETIQGNTSATKRLKLVKDFNSKDDIKVMLISLKAGGTGLNLVGADIVIHLDPWWNVAAEDQASDRAYRIGQTRKVVIYKLVMKNTIEEKVLTLQDKKKDLSDIFDNINSKTGLSDEDINYLLN